MILVKLSGGLGNQMFQYAFGKQLALKNNTVLVLDTSFLQSKLPFKKWTTPMRYELHIFNINAAIKPNFITSNILLYPFAKAEYMIRTKWYAMKYTLQAENDFAFNSNFLNANDNSYVTGNFQSEKYFKSIENEIRNDFTFNAKPDAVNLEWQEKIKECNAVSIHIRRGDYLSISRNAKKFASVPISYFKTAIKLVATKIANPVFFIFSDDLDWAKENLSTEFPVFFVGDNSSALTAYRDMELMSLCKHNIISNSTFSWWAAWLNRNHEKIVISPQKWFEDSSINSTDIYPSEWIKL